MLKIFCSMDSILLMSKSYSTLCKIIGCHFYCNTITSQTLILNFLIFPAVWAIISWLLSRRTLNIALGSNSLTIPLNSINSSLAIFPNYSSTCILLIKHGLVNPLHSQVLLHLFLLH